MDQHPILRLLSKTNQDKIALAGRVMQLPAKKTVLKQGSEPASVFFLLEGSVRVFRRQGDKELLMKLLCAPGLFGESEALSGHPYVDGVMTVERSRMFVMPAPIFRQLLDHEQAFASAVLRDLARRLCIAAANQSSIAFDALDSRLAGLLHDYAECTGTPVGEGDARRIGAGITQRSLALDLGVSRKAVNEALNRLRSAGLLAKVEARYTISSMSSLSALSQREVGFHHRVAI